MPCIEAREALEEAESVFGIDRVIAIDYHIRGPLVTNGVQPRTEYYGVVGTPTVVFGGGPAEIGSVPPPFFRYRPIIAEQLQETSPLIVSVHGTGDASAGSLSYAVEVETATANPGGLSGLTLRVVILEDGVVLEGRTLDRTVREVGPDYSLDLDAEGSRVAVKGEFRLESDWNVDELSLVAWVQRDSDQVVLQADAGPVINATPVVQQSWGALKARFLP